MLGGTVRYHLEKRPRLEPGLAHSTQDARASWQEGVRELVYKSASSLSTRIDWG